MMQTRAKLKKRQLERSPPSSPPKRIKTKKKYINCQIGTFSPLIEKFTLREPLQNPRIKSSNSIFVKSPIESSQDSSIEPTLMNLETKEPIKIISNFNARMNKSFTCRPKHQNPYEHLRQTSAKLYEFSFESSQWIATQLVRYEELDNDRYFLVGDQIYLQKSQKNEEENSLKYYFDNAYYLDPTKIYYIRGPSGVGKSHQLIQNVLIYRNKPKYRILHIILDNMYMELPDWYFLYDFFYCFHNDLEDPNFPKPPSGENWFKYLSLNILNDDSFLKEISEYLKSKEISFLLVWDQDNIFQNKTKDNSLDSFRYNFLVSIRKSKLFNLILISASNSNEGFNDINAKVTFEISVGFSQEETNEYLHNFINKIIGYPVKINDEFLQNLHKLTNGNGYLLSKFIQAEGETLEEKFNKFTKDITGRLRLTLSNFFKKQMINWDSWKDEFPLIITYLDTDIDILNDNFKIFDQNFSYIQNSKLKSVNAIASEIYLDYYEEQLRIHNLSDNYLSSLALQVSNEKLQPVLKGILYERYVILKFQEYLKNHQKILYNYTLNNGKKEAFDCEAETLVISFSDDQLNEVIETFKEGCIIKPFKFNQPYQPVFDLVVWNGKKKFLYIIQVTINSEHPKVDYTFFTDKKYKFLLNHKNVEHIRFLWVTNKSDFKPKHTDDRIGCLTLFTH